MKRKFCHCEILSQMGREIVFIPLETGKLQCSNYFSLWMGKSLCISLYAKIPLHKHSQQEPLPFFHL